MFSTLVVTINVSVVESLGKTTFQLCIKSANTGKGTKDQSVPLLER